MTKTTEAVAKKWLTTGEVAVILGKSPSTIWRWAVQGKLGAEEVTDSGQKTFRIPRKAVDEALRRVSEGLPAIA